MGGDAPANQNVFREAINAYIKYGPQAAGVTSQITPGLAQSELDAARQVSPGYAALQNELLKTYGPDAIKTGTELSKLQAMGDAQTGADVLKGPGKDLATGLLDVSKMVDPEFYGLRETLGKGATSLVSGMDPNRLTESELSNVERGLGRMNPAGLPQGGTKAIENASVFGDALTSKRNNFANALSTAAGVAPQLRSGIDVFQAATGRSAYPNLGATQFSAVPKAGGAGAQQLGSDLFGGALQSKMQASDINSQRRDPLDRITGVLGSLPSIS